MTNEDTLLTQVEKVYDHNDVGTPNFIKMMQYCFPTMTSREIMRIGYKARGPSAFCRIAREDSWWKDSESYTVATVNKPGINAEAFASMYKVSPEMRFEACELKTSGEVFQRMLVVWCAQNGIAINEDLLSYDDLQAYERHKQSPGSKSD